MCCACPFFLLTCHESWCFCDNRECLCHSLRGGRPPSRSSPKLQPNARFRRMHGIVWPLDQYNVIEAEDLALTILREWSSRPLFIRGFNTANLPWKNFVTFDLLSNQESVRKWDWLMKEHYIAHYIACFEGPMTNTLHFSSHFARSWPQNGYRICSNIGTAKK